MSAKAIIGYLISLAIVIGLIIWLGSRGAASSSFSANDPDRPVATAAETAFDFGNMTNNEIRTKVFTIRNTGKSDLSLTRVSTSCDCTYAYITANGEKSERFTMHGTSNWSANVKPNEEAQVEIIYEPAIMPVHGPVTRMVTVVTNDPVTPEVMFSVSANLTD